MLPTLHHGVTLNNNNNNNNNQSRLDYQPTDNGRNAAGNTNNNNSQANNAATNSNSNANAADPSESRLNKSRLLDYSNEHVVHGKATNKYASDYSSHLPHIRQND
jgi:hypothetical protein